MKFHVIGKKQIFYILMGVVWLAALVTVVLLSLSKTAAAEGKRIPVYAVDRPDRKIALTFNAAWGDETTDEVLDVLQRYGVKATFFIVGDFAENYPESVTKIYNAGHELGNHSMRHKDPAGQTYAALAADMDACSDLLFSLTGVRPALYRAPSGAYTNAAIEAAEALGMTAVQWSADSIDWRDPSPEVIVARIEKRTAPGGILLFHLGKQNTARALPEVLRRLTAAGYTFCTVGELLLPGETRIDSRGVQHAVGLE